MDELCWAKRLWVARRKRVAEAARELKRDLAVAKAIEERYGHVPNRESLRWLDVRARLVAHAKFALYRERQALRSAGRTGQEDTSETSRGAV